MAVVFYSNSGGTLAQVVAGGTRDIDISRLDGVEGVASKMTMPITGATVDAQPGSTWKNFDLVTPIENISIACPAASNPETATHYRIWLAT